MGCVYLPDILSTYSETVIRTDVYKEEVVVPGIQLMSIWRGHPNEVLIEIQQ